tara:strand:+ start:2366 stop:3214 length:849 start_codon:yes stop_codon:yes gene_type:complete
LSFHLAGIIPVANEPLDFNMDWHDCLMPLAPNFYAIERAVLECAYAGCETIWIIANDNTTPLVRHRLGDYIQDPVWIGRKNKFPSQSRKPIPIFYIPSSRDHKNKNHLISWNILHGAQTAHAISADLSKWVAPNRFYVSFCHGVYPTEILRPVRLGISKDINFALTFRDKSFATGDMLGFTFNIKQMNQAVDMFKEVNKSLLWGEELENEKEYYEENFALDKVFGHVILYIDEGLEVPWFHQIDGWENYCQFLASSEKSEMRHPGKLIISYREFNPLGEDNE